MMDAMYITGDALLRHAVQEQSNPVYVRSGGGTTSHGGREAIARRSEGALHLSRYAVFSESSAPREADGTRQHLRHLYKNKTLQLHASYQPAPKARSPSR